MVNMLSHYLLTAYSTIHDEEALTALELMGRIGGKVNELVQQSNDLEKDIDNAIKAIPSDILKELGKLIENGSLRTLINDQLLASINARLDTIIASGNSVENNPELVDCRTNTYGFTYGTAGAHIRAIENGEGLNDAVKPGTVKPNRISDGMLTGDLASAYRMKEYYASAGKWNSTGYVEKGTSFITAHTGYNITDAMPCQYGDIFEVTTAIFGNKVYPAFLLNSAGQILKVCGDAGSGDWDFYTSVVSVDHPDATQIRFICGSGYVSNFRALRYTARNGGDIVTARNAYGYIHAIAKKRTDTITDRAQIKMYFPVSEGNHYSISMQCVNPKNCDNYTFRLFACYSNTGYDVSMPESDHGRSYSTKHGIKAFFTMPTSETETPFKYVCLFIDLIPRIPAEKMDVSILNPVLMKHTANGSILVDVSPFGVSLHGAIDPDMICNVRPNAYGGKLCGKVIVGMGDSLMSGNTLPKTESWFNIACGRNDMIFYNHGLNGSPIANSSDSTAPKSMQSRTGTDLASIAATMDYFILQGGANDKRLNVPIENFKSAIRLIVDMVRTYSPACKILFMTNWKRTTTPNGIGLSDDDYVSAMLEMGEELCIPTLNNYASSGVDLTNAKQAAVFDEGIVSTGTANLHFSKAANTFVADYVEDFLKRF